METKSAIMISFSIIVGFTIHGLILRPGLKKESENIMTLGKAPTLQPPKGDAERIESYFYELTLDEEYQNGTLRIKKWVNDIKIFCDGKWSEPLIAELKDIINTLNPILAGLKIEMVTDRSESNFIIFLGAAEDYVSKIEPNAKGFVEKNFGYFWIKWNDQHEITDGNMYVDIERANTDRWRKHLLREELTQALGLMNDSLRYSNSIFYGNHSLDTSYSNFDIAVIKLLYNKNIKANMTKDEIAEIIKSKELLGDYH